MPAFTPIDLIASLAALNRGDVQGFRQPWSSEGRQQTLNERALATQRQELERRLAEYFGGLQPAQLPGAQAQRSTELGIQKEQAGLPFVAPQAEANVRATQAGAGHTEELTRGLQSIFPTLFPQAQANVGATQAGTEHTRATTEGLQKVMPSLFPQAMANVGATQAGTEHTQATTRGLDALFPTMVPKTMADIAHTQAETGVLEGSLQGRQQQEQMQSLVSALMILGAVSPQNVSPALQRLGELTGAKFTQGATNAPGQVGDTFKQWLELRGQKGGEQPSKVEGATKSFVGKALDMPNVPGRVVMDLLKRIGVTKPQTPQMPQVTGDQLKMALQLLSQLGNLRDRSEEQVPFVGQGAPLTPGEEMGYRTKASQQAYQEFLRKFYGDTNLFQGNP